MNKRIRRKREKARLAACAPDFDDPAVRAGTRRGFQATPEEMGRAAVEAARRSQRLLETHHHRSVRAP